jgi:spermidine synthase
MNTTSMVVRDPDRLTLIALGITAMGAQIVVLREGLSLAYGNELVIGILLGTWLTLTGFGSFLGRWIAPRARSPVAILTILLLSAALPIATVVMSILLRVWMFPPGTMLDLASLLFGCFVLLSPFCLVAGAGFVVLTSGFQRNAQKGDGRNVVGRAYGWESLGSFLGGVGTSILMFLLVPSIDALVLLLILDLIVCTVVALHSGMLRWAALSALLCVAVIVVGIFYDLDAELRERLFAGQKVVEYRNTPFGALAVTKQGDQYNIFQNFIFVGSSDDVVAREEAVHYALIQRPRARSVLVVSGGASGVLAEIMKYPAARIDYLEIDPAMVDVVRRFAGGIPSGKVHVVSEDATSFLRRTDGRYDVVLLMVSDPSTIQSNRYFTCEFFHLVKQRLSPEGVVSWSIISSADYLGDEARQVRSVLFTTGKVVFKNVSLIPGERDFFLASDGPLDIHIARAVQASGISTVYVNRSYIDDEHIEARSNEILRSLNADAPLNKDFSPVSTWRQLRYWLTYYESPAVIPLGLLLACLVAVTLRPNLFSAGAFAIGMGGMTLEIILLLGFQIVNGYLYRMTGALLTVFMGGLAAGAYAFLRSRRPASYAAFAISQELLAAVAFVVPTVLCWIRSSNLSAGVASLFFLGVMCIVSVLAGAAFAIGSALKEGDATLVSSELYGSDLSGSAVAAFFVSTILIPSIGFGGASWVAGAVLLFSGAAAYGKGRMSSRMLGTP